MVEPYTEAEQRFLAARRARRNFNLYALTAFLLAWIAIWGAIWAFAPLLINPFETIKRMETQSLAPGTLTALASFGTVAFNLVFLMMSVFLVLMLIWAHYERRYLSMLDKHASAPPPKPEAQ